MASSSACQFLGIDTVLQAYNTRGIDTWGVWQGKTLNTTGAGADSLRAYLSMMNVPTSALYTLVLYKNEDDPDSIDVNTPYQAAFNFRLNDAYMGSFGTQSGLGAIVQRMEALEKRLNEPEDDEDDLSLKKVIGMILENPQKLPQLITGIKMLFGMTTPIEQQPALMGNVTPVRAGTSVTAGVSPDSVMPIQTYEPETIPLNDADPETRLRTAIQMLESNDPDIVRHLELLAKLSNEQPKFFKMMLKQLETM